MELAQSIPRLPELVVQAKPAPDPRNWRPPLLIGDCATAFAGSTMLQVLLAKDHQPDD